MNDFIIKLKGFNSSKKVAAVIRIFWSSVAAVSGDAANLLI